MRAKITVTDDSGQTFEGECDLVPGVKRDGTPRTRSAPAPAADAKIDFTLPRRAFLKQHAQGKSGAQKFAALIAHMTQGKAGVEVKGDDAKREWMQNKGVLGGNLRGMYPTRSKGEGWTDSPKQGTFVLREGWRAALRRG